MKKYIIIGIIIVVLGGGYFWFRSSKTPSYITAIVARSSIKQEVSANGSVATPTMINLQFQNSGKLTFMGVKVGDSVKAGEVISRQDSSVLNAQLQQAEANLIIAEQSVSSSKNNIKNVTSQQDTLVETAYQNLLNSTPEAVPKDSTQNYTAPTISGNYILGKVGIINLHLYYSTGGVSFTLSGLTAGTGMMNSITSQALGNSGLYVKSTTNNIDTADWVIEIPNKKASNYLTNYNAYQLALETRDKAIADAESSVGTSETLSSVTDAQITQAKASIASIQAQITQMILTAPVDGVVTKVNGSVGEIVSLGDTVVSIIPNAKLQIDANVSEANIANVKLGNSVVISLDAFPGTEWQGTVTQIDPAQTIIGGAVYYKTTIVFNKPDDQIKSGMTANVLIETGNASNTLIVPASAIQNKNANTFVQIFQDKKTTNQNVTTGLKSQDGMIEITSGLSEGQLVITETK